MKEIKKISIRVFLVLEILVFGFIYFFGPNGIKALKLLEAKNKKLYEQILSLDKEVNDIKIQLDQWENDMFYKEKVAREFLQMSKEGEEVYLVV